ncbi:MAG: NAD(P)H-dependent oxidoreductase [Rhabdochlamydiaceae bacterium]|nr:NAD(P)H-dependent oxidoreductase [Rhabdochlamydiaceae bacterium]
MTRWILCLCAVIFLSMAPVAAEIHVLALSGSLRSDSYNKKLALHAAELAKQMGATVTVIDLKDYPMPFYDGDLEKEQGMPENARKLRALLRNNQAIIIASPNYNGSISGVLKNALDWASRGENGGESLEPLKGKPFALMSTSAGKKGGSKGLPHLRQIVEKLGGIVVPTLASIPFAASYFSDRERPENPQLKQEIHELLEWAQNLPLCTEGS